MASRTFRIGLFTATNIAAILGAIPSSDGTYKNITEIAQRTGADPSHLTVARWVTKGRKERAGRANTALARDIAGIIPKYCNDGNGGDQ